MLTYWTEVKKANQPLGAGTGYDSFYTNKLAEPKLYITLYITKKGQKK